MSIRGGGLAEDYARRQAWSQLFLGDGKYVVLSLLRVDDY